MTNQLTRAALLTLFICSSGCEAEEDVDENAQTLQRLHDAFAWGAGIQHPGPPPEPGGVLAPAVYTKNYDNYIPIQGFPRIISWFDIFYEHPPEATDLAISVLVHVRGHDTYVELQQPTTHDLGAYLFRSDLSIGTPVGTYPIDFSLMTRSGSVSERMTMTLHSMEEADIPIVNPYTDVSCAEFVLMWPEFENGTVALCEENLDLYCVSTALHELPCTDAAATGGPRCMAWSDVDAWLKAIEVLSNGTFIPGADFPSMSTVPTVNPPVCDA